MRLRPYQTQAVAEVDALRAQGAGSVVLQAPTGSGKTVMAAELVRRAMDRGDRVMFLAPRRELVHQAADKLEALGLRHGWDFGVIMSGVDGAEQLASCPLQVASKDTLRSRVRRRTMPLPAAQLVIADECHLSLSKTWQSLLTTYRDQGAFVVGLSATPCRGDGRGLGRFYDALVTCPSVQELTDAGYLVPARYFAPSVPDLAGVGLDYKSSDYRRGELEDRVNRTKIVGDIVDHWLEHAGGRRTVVFCAGVQHSLHVVRSFRAHGVSAAHVDGGTPVPDRERLFRDFRSGAIQVLTNCDVATYGFDLPELDCIVMARPTQSIVLHLQMLGRGLRPANGKSDCLVLDHAGNVTRHGFAADEVPWTLDDQEKVTELRDEERRKRKETLPTTCPQCQHLYRNSAECPNCGWIPERTPRNVAVAEGELVEIDANGPAEDPYEWYLMAKGDCERRGGNIGAAYHAFLKRFGYKPPWAWQDYPSIEPDLAVVRYLKHLRIAYAKRRGANQPVAESARCRDSRTTPAGPKA